MPDRIEDEVVAKEAVDVGTLVAENASLRDRLLRALADAENTRRRAAREAEESRRYAIAEFARELLMVVDNLQRTVAAAETAGASSVEGTALVEGVRATLRVLMRTLESFDIKPIEALGRRFDPNVHEAIMEAEDPAQPSGTIVRVVEQGYMINDRLLRPARVIVSKRPTGDDSGSDEPTGAGLAARSTIPDNFF